MEAAHTVHRHSQRPGSNGAQVLIRTARVFMVHYSSEKQARYSQVWRNSTIPCQDSIRTFLSNDPPTDAETENRTADAGDLGDGDRIAP